MNKEPRKIEAVIYDVDGTISDTEPLHEVAWNMALQVYGHSLSELTSLIRNGMTGQSSLKNAVTICQEFGLDTPPQAFADLKQQEFLKLIATELEPLPGVIESMKRFHHLWLKLGIGTTRDRTYTEAILRKFNVFDLFLVIITGDDVSHSKPDPETYVLAAERPNLSPHSCLVIEDSTTGIRSAKAAGCYCVAITYPGSRAQDTSEADMNIKNLDELSNEVLGLI